MRPFRPDGTVAVVTGGASGIGRALARTLLARGARAVVVADIDRAAAQRAADELGRDGHAGDVWSCRLDVSSEAAVMAVVDEVASRHGPIDLWCSNAGISVGSGLGERDDWDRVLGVNLLGHVHAARAVLPGMLARGAGSFLVTASAAGLLSDLRSAPYTASKHGAVALAEWLAIRHLGDGVGVHCACPEGVRTAMTRGDSMQAGAGPAFMEADDVATHVLDAMARGAFLILPHPRVAAFEARRATDRERWIAGMNKALLRMRGADALPVGATAVTAPAVHEPPKPH